MRLAGKLIVALVLGLGAVLAISGWLRVGREIEVFETDMQRDHEEVARVLEPSLTTAWRVGGSREIVRVVDQNAQNGRLALRWVPPGAGSTVDQGWRSHLFPLRVDGAVVGGLQISERRDAEEKFVRTTKVRTAEVTCALSAMAAAIVAALTYVLVGGPVRRLREKTRRIASGDLGGALEIRQRDEIGDLARDIDKMCEDLARARQRADEETGARTRALDQLRHADRLASVGTLASGLAHELGTPLGVVLARARFIEEDEQAPAPTATSARVIAEQVERMSRIIRQLLDFARSGRRQTGPKSDAVDVAALSRSVAALLQPLARKRQVRVVAEEAPPVLARGESGLLQQVILNLVMNSVQAMQEAGDVSISATATEAQPPPGTEAAPGPYVRLRIEDQGPGIPPEAMPRIFEPFFTTKPIGEGTGLGLSVIWGIVREHGGWIEVANVPGAGARFDVFVPAA